MNKYIHLTINERRTIEELLNKRCSISKIACILKRSKSTISEEICRNRTITRGINKGATVEKLPKSMCPKLCKSPGVCNGCHSFGYCCSHIMQLYYSAIQADSLSANRNSQSRQSLDISKENFEKLIYKIKDGLRRKLSPYQISLHLENPKVSQSTIYRWIDKGYADLTKLDLPKSVRYRPRRKKSVVKVSSHGPQRGYAAFCNLSQDQRDSACEMDTVIGRRTDRKCILTLYLRPSKFQFMFLLKSKTVRQVNNALTYIEEELGPHLFKDMFGVILTDNGIEFSDHNVLETSSFHKGHKRTSIYYCDVRATGEKGACEKNHVEIRKIIPKKTYHFDSFDPRIMSTIMSHVNSQARRSLGGKSPIQMLKIIYGNKVQDFLDTLGIKEIPYTELNLTPEILNLDHPKY